MPMKIQAKARVGWNVSLGNTMRLRLELTPSVLGAPITDMTTITAVSVLVERSDGTTSTWVCSLLGSATSALSVWTYVYQAGDLPVADTLRCTALMTTGPGQVTPSEPFGILVES